MATRIRRALGVLEGGLGDETMDGDLKQANSCAVQSNMLQIGLRVRKQQWHRVGSWGAFGGLSGPSRDTGLAMEAKPLMMKGSLEGVQMINTCVT